MEIMIIFMKYNVIMIIFMKYDWPDGASVSDMI